jgi:feruloyl-CoA hydratase/lyase
MKSGQAGATKAETSAPGGKTVLVAFEDGIAWVTMNRPDKRNCISPALAGEMLGVINALEADPRCQILVLTGAGDSFSAGMDLKEFFRDNDHLSPNERAHIYRQVLDEKSYRPGLSAYRRDR